MISTPASFAIVTLASNSNHPKPVPRILTYNVHRCVGTDRRLDVGRVAEVIAAQAPDIVALQELDVGRARTGGVDQAHEIAGGWAWLAISTPR